MRRVLSGRAALAVPATLLASTAAPHRLAFAQGASDLSGTHAVTLEGLAECARRAPLEARALAIEAVERLCDGQNARMAAGGYPSCTPGECVDTVIGRSGGTPTPVEFQFEFVPEAGRVALSFRMPIDADGGGAGARWTLRCRAPYDFLAWHGKLPEAEGFFDTLLAALPRCNENARPEGTRRSTHGGREGSAAAEGNTHPPGNVGDYPN